MAIFESNDFHFFREFIAQQKQQEGKVQLQKDQDNNITLNCIDIQLMAGEKVILEESLTEEQFLGWDTISLIRNNLTIDLASSVVNRLGRLSDRKFNIAQIIVGKVDDPENIGTDFIKGLCDGLEEVELDDAQLAKLVNILMKKVVNARQCITNDLIAAINVAKSFSEDKLQKFHELLSNIDIRDQDMLLNARYAVETLNAPQFARVNSLLQKKSINYHNDFCLIIDAAQSFNQAQFEKFSELVMMRDNMFLVAKQAVELLNERDYERFKKLLKNDNISGFHAFNAITDNNLTVDGFKKLCCFVEHGYVIGGSPRVCPNYIAYNHDDKTLTFYDENSNEKFMLNVNGCGINLSSINFDDTKNKVLTALYEIDFGEVGGYSRKDNQGLRQAINVIQKTQEHDPGWLDRVVSSVSEYSSSMQSGYRRI